MVVVAVGIVVEITPPSLLSPSSESALSPAVIVAVVIVVEITQNPPLPAEIHLTTGWLLCQKIRLSWPATTVSRGL